MRSTFKILFYINRSKVKNGLAPIMARITLNGTVAQFSCKISVEPHLWSVGINRAGGRGVECKRINSTLDEIREGLTQHYRTLINGGTQIDAATVKQYYLGLRGASDLFLVCFDRHNSDFLLRVGKDRSRETYAKYVIVRNHLADFIRRYYDVDDISMKSIREEFLRRFQSYLSAQCSLASSTVWMYCIALRMIMSHAHKNGIVPNNPFVGYRITPQIGERGYLLDYELDRLMRHDFKSKYLTVVRDMFVFACFTGLSYIDIKTLTRDKMTRSFDGQWWIVSSREKTRTAYRVKLLDVPLMLIGRYDAAVQSDYIFPIPSNSVCNERLKRIALECGFNKRLTFHLSRHTFATMALTKGVSIESVSKILGHTKLATTQIYAKITNAKIGEDMDLLSSRLGSMVLR